MTTISMVSVLDWIPASLHSAIAMQRNGADLKTYIQNAFDQAPVGCNLYFPAGEYRVFSGLTMNRQMNLIGEDAFLSGYFPSDSTDNLLNVRVQEAPNSGGDVRRMKIEGMVIAISTHGRNALDVENNPVPTPSKPSEPPNPSMAANLHMLIERCGLGVPDRSAGWAVRFGGLVTQAHTIRHCQIGNGIHLDQCADQCRIVENIIGGTKVGIFVNVHPGAFNTIIRDNIIVSRDGAINIGGGSQVMIRDNQIEQPDATQPSNAPIGRNQSTFKSHITVYPLDYPCRRVQITGNNFGGGGNLDACIHCVSGSRGVEDLLIDGNTFNPGTPASSAAGTIGYDIRLMDAGIKGTRIGPNNMLRGSRGGVTVDANGNASPNGEDEADLLYVHDLGEGTYGVWKKGADLAFANGWTAHPSFRFRKTLDDQIQMEGRLTGGALAAGTQIATLPIGFRPKNTVYLPVATGAGVQLLSVTAGGQIEAVNLTHASVYLDGSTFRAKGRNGYDPHV